MHLHLLQVLLSSSRYSKIQGFSYPVSGTCTHVLCFSLIFLLRVFWSVLVQRVLRGINHNFHSIQSSSHPESGRAFCQMWWLRRAQSKLQRWMPGFLKVLGLPLVSCRGAQEELAGEHCSLELPVVSWMTHLGWFVPSTPQAHPWPVLPSHKHPVLLLCAEVPLLHEEHLLGES